MDINELLSSLSPDDIEKLKETAASLLGDNEEKAQSVASILDKRKEDTKELSVKEDDAQMVNALVSRLGSNKAMPTLLKAMGELEKNMNKRDARSDFLFALKPLLKKHRQSKVDEAVKIMRLFSLLPLLKGER
ncbi:MAG TPA: hypothetical protein PLD98_03710 [Clostridiales bacterium]|nr:hypothetical protein [Clostridiales bacterium]